MHEFLTILWFVLSLMCLVTIGFLDLSAEHLERNGIVRLVAALAFGFFCIFNPWHWPQ